jgi:hypothetical protein
MVVAFAMLSASAFAVSVQAGRWWSLADVEIGPFGSRQCFGGECRPAGLGWIDGGERWARIGIATWAAGLMAMLVLVVLAGAVAAGRIPRLAARTALVAIGVAIVSSAAFVIGYPGVAGAGVDRGLVLYAGAIVLGLAAAITVLRRARA